MATTRLDRIHRLKGEQLSMNLSSKQALEIASAYTEKYNLSGKNVINNERTVKSYDGFDGVEGITWIVLVTIEPTIYHADSEFSIIISDEKSQVEYIIDANGHYYAPHIKGSGGMTDEEFDSLWDDDSDS